MTNVTYHDVYVSRYSFGINLRNNGYKLTMTDEYKSLIDYLDVGSIDWDIYEQRMRNVVLS